MALPTASDNTFTKLLLAEGAAPATPASGKGVIYFKADGLAYSKDDAGVETLMSSGPGSGIAATIVDAKGDIIAATAADTVARVAVGTNDMGLVADSAATPGLRWDVQPSLGRRHSVIRSECIYPEGLTSGNNVGNWDGLVSQVSGTAAAISGVSASSGSAHMGIIQCSTGTDTTGRCGIASGGSMVSVAAGRIRGFINALLSTLSDGTNTYTVWIGLANSATGNGSDGIFFRYTHGTNSGKWQAVCRASSVETATDTGVAADTSYHSFEIDVNAAGTSVDFKIDGTVVATVATNVPTAAMRLLPLNIVKSAGATARTALLDAFQYILEFSR